MQRGVDPFGDTCDPRLYVPRLGTEAALSALREGFARGRCVSVLSGPPGLGKTMVLQVLASQLAPARCVYLPYSALAVDGLAQWALDSLGERSAAARAPGALTAAAADHPSTPLVLLIDDASAVTVVAARALREMVDAAAGALRVVAAVVDDARASTAIAALGDEALHVRLSHRLAPHEVHAYVRGRIERAGAQALLQDLRDDLIDWLAAESAGVPRVVNGLATQLLWKRMHAIPLELGGEEDPDGEAKGAGGEASARERAASAAASAAASGAIAEHDASATSDLTSANASGAPNPPRRRRRLRRHRGWY
jgi:type II secretory pathway predicted ATPase ExeA